MPEFTDTAEFEGVTALRDSPDAVLVAIDGEPHWLPKSQIDDTSEVWDASKDGRGPGTLVVSEWIATEKGLV